MNLFSPTNRFPPLAAGARKYLKQFEFVRSFASLARRLPKWPRIIPSYVKRLGLQRGFVALALMSFGRRPVKVHLPELREPLSIRPRTSDKLVFEQIFLRDEYDIETDFHPRLIVDAGANVGYASIYFASRWPDARIIAIEPDRTNFAVLKNNLIAYPSVHAIQAAVWSRHEMLSLQTGSEAWSSRVGPASDGDVQLVGGITLDEVLARTNATELDLLKLDVEGAECELFTNPGDWLKQTRIIVAELHDRIIPGCSEALEQATCGLGFSRSVLGENVVLVRDQ